MPTKARILVVDDEPGVRDLLKTMLARKGHSSVVAASGDEALKRLDEGGFDLVITDLRMPGLPGEELVARVKQVAPELPVVVISAFGGTQSVVEVVKRGAEDYLAKPFKQEDLELVVYKALEKHRLLRENARLRRELKGEVELENMVGASLPMQKVFSMLRRIAPSTSHALITGESGTGKELAARALHNLSPRAKGPFVQVNAGALPATLFEAELFGARKGAYTGADEDRQGLFQAADGGTLFLDEVGEVPLGSQAKLLRVLESGELKVLGEAKARKVDVRVVAATNRNLEAMVEEGTFRRDLYFRLAVLPLFLPPLRERPEDIPQLAETFLARGTQPGGPKHLSPEALKALLAYGWPGNVRELKNVLERAGLMGSGSRIEAQDLIFTGSAVITPSGGLFRKAKQRMIADFEKAFVKEALKSQQGNVSKAAAEAGLARQNFQALMKKYGVKRI
ncbi:MAG: sigma-54 dependent transcriptional regulator [candidate division FCPU426 bacterium]